ncbi:hypothetical protein ACVOMV_06415 [Mesorhizobium atlanticum]
MDLPEWADWRIFVRSETGDSSPSSFKGGAPRAAAAALGEHGEECRDRLANRAVVIGAGRIALNLDVPVTKARRHGSAELAHIEGATRKHLFNRA